MGGAAGEFSHLPVVAIDGAAVGNGNPGSIATELRAAFHDVAEKVR